MLLAAGPHGIGSASPPSRSWFPWGNSRPYLLVVVVVVLWDKNVVLLQQSGKVLANERPDVEKGDHDGEHAEEAEGHLRGWERWP